jgi:hypothetical protein
MTMLIRAMNEIRSFSTYLKLEQVKPNFGLNVVRALNGPSSPMLTVAGQGLPWGIIQQYFSASTPEQYPEVFSPHVQAEDLQWVKPEDVLYRLEPALKFWHDMSTVAALHDGGPVPLGLVDNVVSYCNSLSYDRRTIRYFQKALYSELYLRYLNQWPLNQDLLAHLDASLIGARPVFTEEVWA